MNEPRIVTPEEERLVLAYEIQRRLREKADRIAELEGHIAAEPDRIRAAEADVWALGHAAGVLANPFADQPRSHADLHTRVDEIENGADW